MLRDPAQLRQLIGEYGTLRRLEGHTPQSRGQRFNGLIAEMLRCWGIDAIASDRSAGEIDVLFAADGVRYILEAKWEASKADTGEVAKLQKRVRQRLAGTYGVFLSISGYSAEALADVKDGERLEVLLLDGGHWEAMLGGLISPAELLGLVRDQAAFRGRAYTPVTDLFALSAQIPAVSFEAPSNLPNGGLVSAVPDVSAEIVLSKIRSGQLGIACSSPDKLLVTTEDAILDVDLIARNVGMAVPVTRCQRSPVILGDGTILFVRGNGVGRLSEGTITTAAGAFAGNTCLLLNPDGGPWAFDNGGEPDRTASLTSFGTQFGDQARYEVDYPAAQAFTAAWISATEVLAIGNNGFRVCSPLTGERRGHEALQTNPMGIVHLGKGIVLTAGNAVSLVQTDTQNWNHHEVARLAVSPSVNELTQSPDGAIYLASYYPTPEQGLTYAVIRIQLPHEGQ
jgi:hypothetical protein